MTLPKTGSSPDPEAYPKARAASTEDNAQQIIGWKTFLIEDGNLEKKKRQDDENIKSREREILDNGI